MSTAKKSVRVGDVLYLVVCSRTCVPNGLLCLPEEGSKADAITSWKKLVGVSLNTIFLLFFLKCV